MKFRLSLWCGLAAIVLAGCSSSSGGSASNATGSPGTTETSDNSSLPLVALSQANSSDPWRQVFDAETKSAADTHSKDFRYEEQAAEDDPNKQISQLDTEVLKSPKVMLISPIKESVEAAVSRIYDAKIPVVLLDRSVPGDKYTCVVGGDNVDIGRQAGEYIAKRLNGKGVVLMIQGLGGATPTLDRANGAMSAFNKYPGITVIHGDDCKYQRQAAQNYMESFLQKNQPFDAVYAHNDEMAIGAYQAWSRSGQKTRPIFVGIDGCQKEMIDMIQDGKIDATFKYPIPGPAGIEIAAEILKGKMPSQKKIILPTEMVTKDNAAKYIADNPHLAK